MTSAISPAQNPANAANSATAAASSSSGTSSPLTAVPAQQPRPSYASATKTFSPAPTGSNAPVQHGKSESSTPVNGKNSMAAPPVAGGSAVVNSNINGVQGDHGRKASVVISASGASGNLPNGGPVGQSGSRPNISFGSMNQTQGSPAIASSQPYQSQAPSLSTPNPRITSPAHSPSPIPQPAASGGKPPAMQGQSNGLSFGSMGAENGDQSNRGPVPHNPHTPSAQPIHLRRESSQSAHSDMSGAGMPNMRGNFVPNGRGRGFSPYSPHQNFRQLPNQSRGPPNMPPQFQSQAGMSSPYGRGRGSPAMMPAQPHMPQGMAGQPQMQYGGYPAQHLNAPHQAMYTMDNYNPYAGFYNPYYPQQGQFQPAPPSPRPGQFQPPYGVPPTHMQPQYNQPMSRSPSQISERPGSSLGPQPTPSGASNGSQGTHTPAPSTPAPQSSNFQIPKPKSKAIVIKNDKGEEVSFQKPSPSPAPVAQPQSPAIVSSTPPPRTPSTPSQAQNKPPPSKADAEATKNAFQEQVKRQMEAAKAKEEEAKKAEQQKSDAETKEKVDAEAKATQEKADADAKATKEKADAEAAKEAESKKAAEKAEQAEKDAADKAASEKAAAEKETADKAKAEEEDEEARKKREEEEWIAELEAQEKEEEERERAYAEKKAKAAEEQKKRDAEAAANADEEMKRLEREAEERELAKEKEREGKVDDDSAEAKAEREKLFASLKKPTLGPGATSGTETPASDVSEDQAAAPAKAAGQKPKPGPLKLETNKPVEPAQPTAGMQALKSARVLDLANEEVKYPSGFASPNPALNQAAKRGGRGYDKAFLLQFQEVFKEKPTVDWDQRVKDTLGDGDASARATPGGRTPSSMGGRQPSNRGGAFPSGPMGSFGGGGGGRTLPPGTTSQDRFLASQSSSGRPGMGNPMASFANRPGGFPMGGAQPMSRTNSLQAMPGAGPGSPRSATGRGGRGSRRGPSERGMSKREEEQQAKSMPLTAGLDLKPLEKSQTGWKPMSLGQAAPAGPDPSGNMAPDMVQRKVKAALNKMTPENFEKISDQIMEIANQSKKESDGRTLRQVIQLTFEKACDEAHWAGMYARFCQKMLTSMSTEILDENVRDKSGQPVVGGALFRKYLLNRCQEEFERGWEANLPEKPEGDSQEAALLSDEYYIAAAAKRRGLGLIQFIGELYKLSMLTIRIMHQCVMRLLNFEGQPDESAVENLCRLLKTVGATMDANEQGAPLVNAYFERISSVLDNNKDMPSRPRFMLMDVIDLRRKGWRSKDDQKGPKTIQQIHEEAQAAAAAAELERAKTQRGGPGGRMPMGRGDARNFSGGMPPPDYPRNQVGMDDLRKLQNRGASNRQASQGLGPNLGPSSLFSSRSGSGRKGLGPPRDGESSGPASRTGTPPAGGKKEETNKHVNAFSALAGLDGSESAEHNSPPSEAGSPPVAKATPSIDTTVESKTEEEGA